MKGKGLHGKKKETFIDSSCCEQSRYEMSLLILLPVLDVKIASPIKGEAIIYLFYYICYLTDKIIDNLHFLIFLSVYFLNFAHHNPADQPIQYSFI